MSTSPLPIRFPFHRHTTSEARVRKAKEFQAVVQLLEDLVPNFNNEEERKFYRGVVQSYRAAAKRILRRAWSDDKGQDIAEYAVMLAVILVIVVGTVRLVGSQANNAFSAVASSLQ